MQENLDFIVSVTMGFRSTRGWKTLVKTLDLVEKAGGKQKPVATVNPELVASFAAS